MPASISLDRSNPLLPAEDYESLRRQGFKSIEKLGSDNWTEYNNSDPGITILEAVCYAITDLAYRSGFEIKDLLAPSAWSDDAWKNIFYTARNILHNNPLTLTDYRKLIIDIRGVRNAWIEPSKDYEVPVWVNYNYYRQDEEHDCGCGGDDKGCFGKLELEPANPDREEAWKTDRLNTIQATLKEMDEKSVQLDAEITALQQQVALERELSARRKLEAKLKKLHRNRDKHDERKRDLIKERKVLVMQVFIPSKIVELEGLYNILVEYEEDIDDDERVKVRRQVIHRLHANRNLCEDFLGVNAAEYIDVGMNGSFAIEDYADPDRVLAEIFFALYKYFTPSVPFHTIPQMLEKGYRIDEIFEGPPLKSGFIENTAIEKTDFFRDMRLSDIISEITDLEGMKAVTYLHIPNTDDALTIPGEKHYFAEWVKMLREEKKLARVIPELSHVVFCKEREVITYFSGDPEKDRNPARMLKIFEGLKHQERQYKLKGHDKDLPVPAGEYMELQDYYPVTYSLPIHYGVSERAGLPADATETRKVQSLQLGGYLLFFEQLILNYQVQLDHLRDLFSFSSSQERTYFSRPLMELENLQALVIDHAGRGEDHFDAILDDFSKVIQYLVEPPKLFLQRRNKFLDHLLARFSENIDEYEKICRWLVPQGVDERMIRDKAAILEDDHYYRISSGRAGAYNYTVPSLDTTNISGAEERISRLLGFTHVEQRELSPRSIIIEPLMVEDETTHTLIRKKNKNGKPLSIIKIVDPANREQIFLTSVEVVEGCCTEELLNRIMEFVDDRKYYVFADRPRQGARNHAAANGAYRFELWDGTDPETDTLLAVSRTYPDPKQRENAFDELQELVRTINENEGLHLLEHILLRPKVDLVFDEAGVPIKVSFPEICLDTCDLERPLDDRIIEPGYRKWIYRIPAEECFDEKPWVLEFHRRTNTAEGPRFIPFLFRKAFPNGDPPEPLSFHRYTSLVKRLREICEYGTERINYRLDEADDKVSFLLYGPNDKLLAQSDYIFTKDNIEAEIDGFMRYLEYELDLYCEPDPCFHNEDPYSLRCTIVLPCWPRRFRNPTFRHLVEKTIHSELPAHIHPTIKWIGMQTMKEFEKVFFAWLAEMEQTELPVYDIVNPLVEILGNLTSCGCCHDDCSDTKTG